MARYMLNPRVRRVRVLGNMVVGPVTKSNNFPIGSAGGRFVIS